MKNILLVFVLFSTSLNAQIFKEIFKYSTVFGSYTESSPLTQTSQYFVTQGGDLIDVTPEQSNDYMVTFGIRKIARMDYENKAERFYDGTESLSSLNSNIGAIKGLEYLFQFSKGSQQNNKFTSQRYFVRYIANYWVAKIEMQQNGLINLDYKTADLRLRLPIGKKFSVSAGAAVRTHQPYGYSPIATYLEDLAWWDLAYEYGFQDNFYGIDYDNDGEIDSQDWWWSNEDGERVADTDLDFRRNDYEDIVNDYNETKLNDIGTLGTLSAVIGADYYHFRDKWWIHSWANVFPKHQHILGDETYSYETFVEKDNWVDYNYGVIFGWNINKNIGIFTEYERTSFWDKNLVFMKAGLNFRL